VLIAQVEKYFKLFMNLMTACSLVAHMQLMSILPYLGIIDIHHHVGCGTKYHNARLSVHINKHSSNVNFSQPSLKY